MTIESALRCAREALAAFDRLDWKLLVGFVHPDAVRAFQEQQMRFVALYEASRQLLEQHYSRDTPDAVREYFKGNLVKAERDETPRARLPLSNLGIESVHDFEQLDPLELLVRYLTHEHPRSDTSSTRAVIGGVQDGPVVHVLYRNTRKEPLSSPHQEIELLSMRPFGNDWRILLNRELIRTGSIRIYS